MNFLARVFSRFGAIVKPQTNRIAFGELVSRRAAAVEFFVIARAETVKIAFACN